MDYRDFEKFGKKVFKVIKDKAEAESGNSRIIDQPMPVLYEKKTGLKVLGILLMIFGYGCGMILLLWSLVMLVGMAVVGELEFGLILAAIHLVLIAGCGFAAYKGTTIHTSLTRFQTYIRAIGDDEYCNIDRLAKKVGKSIKFVIRDLEKMIQKGWFCQGHLDQQKTCLMITDRMYAEYRQLEVRREQQKLEEETRLQDQQRKEEQRREELEREKKTQNLYRKKLPPEVQRIIEQGDAYVRKIRECNDAIPGEIISAKMSHMEMLVDNIFDRVEQNPETVADIRRLMEYYLPTTVKLLETYAEMDAQPVGGSNIQSAKREIEASLDTINAAFEKLLDSLFQETAWDVSSDISVLNTMLAQEGLKEDGLRK